MDELLYFDYFVQGFRQAMIIVLPLLLFVEGFNWIVRTFKLI